jgi:hypothetical protein
VAKIYSRRAKNAGGAMKKLVENSIHIYPGILVHWRQTGEDSVLNMTETALKFNGRYSTNNSTVCFVVEQRVYATPYTRRVIEVLHEAGLCRDYFYVPFSNGDEPKMESDAWRQIRVRAEQSYKSDFVSDCESWCDKHDIGKISEDSLRYCLLMPENGVPVRRLRFEDRYYPVVNNTYVDCTVVNSLGKFCTNNGICVFVYRDGNTYISKGYGIVGELKSAGYVESGIFVPFSNGEKITDPCLKAIWDGIPKKR